MTIDLTGGQIVQALMAVLFACLAFFIRQWISRLQSDLKDTNSKVSDLTEKLNSFKLQCATDYAQKSEIRSGRVEMMEAIHAVAEKVDRLFDKLDKKADKP